MFIVVTVIHVVACFLLIGVVLLQQGKGADMGAVFGGSSSTIFGSGGAGNFLTRLTTGLAVAFMLTSLTLTYASARRIGSTVFDAAPLPEAPPLEIPAQSGPGVGVQPAPPAAAVGEPQAVAPQAAPGQAAPPIAEAPAAEPEAGGEPAGDPVAD